MSQFKSVDTHGAGPPIQVPADSKPTPGPWTASPTEPKGDWVVHAAGIPQQLAYLPASRLVNWPLEANAALIAEAGTVHHETGMTPQQLRAAWDEARSMLLGAECAEQSLAKENEQLREQRDELLAALQFVDLRLSQVQPGHGTRANDLVDHLRPPIRAAIAKVEGLL